MKYFTLSTIFMTDAAYKLAHILRTSPEVLLEMDKKMRSITGQERVLDDIVIGNEKLVDQTLLNLGLDRNSKAEDVYEALVERLVHIDQHLFELLGHPDLTKGPVACAKLCETALKIYPPPKGLFIKPEKVAELLEKYPPANMLNHFGYSNTRDLVEKEGFAPVVSGLRFTHDEKWMHEFFDKAYLSLKPDDFEERSVKLIVLENKWLEAAEKFLEKKYHNVSHLKEYGVIFLIPLKLDSPGETMRMFTLMLHYLHEVPFYANLFRKFLNDTDFAAKFNSLLRGDVPRGPLPDSQKTVWRIIQRYLAKDDENDFRLFEPHVNPEAENWYQAEEDLGRLARMLVKEERELNLGYWTGLDHVGDFFKNKDGVDQLVSFDLIDLIMSLVKKSEVKYLYHQEEALWNKIFIEYLGRDAMNRLVEEHIIDGFIEL